MFPLIVPRQSAPVLNGRLLADAWYLYLQAVQVYASTAGGIVRYGTSAERIETDESGLLDGTLWIETDTGRIYQWRASALAWALLTGLEVIDETLTSSSTISAPAEAPLELVYIIRQDATGGRTITWGAGFEGAQNVTDAQALAASTLCVFRFILSPVTGLYAMSCQPTLGMTP